MDADDVVSQKKTYNIQIKQLQLVQENAQTQTLWHYVFIQDVAAFGHPHLEHSEKHNIYSGVFIWNIDKQNLYIYKHNLRWNDPNVDVFRRNMYI